MLRIGNETETGVKNALLNVHQDKDYTRFGATSGRVRMAAGLQGGSEH